MILIDSIFYHVEIHVLVFPESFYHLNHFQNLCMFHNLKIPSLVKSSSTVIAETSKQRSSLKNTPSTSNNMDFTTYTWPFRKF